MQNKTKETATFLIMAAFNEDYAEFKGVFATKGNSTTRLDESYWQTGCISDL